LHDIGMLCISAEILNKPGRLTEEEFSRVKQHTELGAEMAGKIVMPAQAAWIRGHHERWDGAGYPDGLEADEIPEGAAILALADAWDSMTMARTYAVMRTREDALTEVRREAGFQFSPAAVDGLERVFDVTSAPPPLQLEAPEPETLEAPTDIEDARSQE
jgi:HD-GYP domain-containing protein (c-di-GMP phosphodiesterase class II)